MLEGDCLFVAWNAPFRCLKSDIRMEKCGREELFCDIDELDHCQMTKPACKSCANGLLAKYMRLKFKI